MTTNTRFNEELILQPLRARADKVMTATLGVLLLVSLVVATFTDSWGIALAVGIPALGVPFAIFRMAPGSLVSRIAVGCAFMVFSALLIQQTHGMIETHFTIFVLLAFLLYYRDWRPVVAASAVIAVHHLAFNFMQGAGLGVYILASGPNLGIIVLHAAYVIFEAAMLIFLASSLRREALESLQVAALAELIGQGDLSSRLDAKQLAGRPLLTKIADMQKQLAATICEVNAQTGLVSSTAERLSESSRKVGHSMHEENEATASMAASIEEFTVSINHISENAEEALRLSHESEQSSASGAYVVKSAIGEMQSIAVAIRTLSGNMDQLGGQFDKVANVVNMIKDIAGQTNLLALNAAIEAARAGEQGRGFAVVADEVRKLAEHTSKATEDINHMMQEIQTSKAAALASIEQAVNKAESGVGLAGTAGDTIDAITQQVQRVQQFVAEISSALREQSSAASEIAHSVERISEMVETSSSSMNSAVSDTDQLHQSAQAVNAALERFRLS